jgi:thiol:disulfide interchange protein
MTLVTAHEPVELNWESDWQPAVQRAETENKVVLVDFYADWCLWCKKLETTTFNDSKVSSYLSGHVVPVKLDVEGDGEELSEKYEVDGLPTVVVMTADGTELGRIVGYMSPSSFLVRLEEILATS